MRKQLYLGFTRRTLRGIHKDDVLPHHEVPCTDIDGVLRRDSSVDNSPAYRCDILGDV